MKTTLGITFTNTANTIGTKTNVFDITPWNKGSKYFCSVATTECTNETAYTKVESLTEYASAVIDSFAMKLTYTALNTIYSQSADKMIYTALCELCAMKNQTFTAQMEVLTENEKTALTENLQIANESTRYFNHKICKYMERKTPKITFTNTALNTLDNESYTYRVKAFSNAVCEDVLSTSKLALVELIQLYGVNDLHTLNAYRPYVYRRINTFIRAEKRNSTTNESLESMVENNDSALMNKSVSLTVDNKVYMGEVKEMLSKYVNYHTRRDIDGKKVVNAFWDVRVLGKRFTDVAKSMNLHDEQLNRLLKLCERVLNSEFKTDNGTRKAIDEVKKFIAVA